MQREREWLERRISNKPSSKGHTASLRSLKRNQYEEEAQTRVRKRKASESQTEEEQARGVWKKGTYRWMASQHRVNNNHLNHVHFEADLTTTRTQGPLQAASQPLAFIKVNREWSDGSKTKSQPRLPLGNTDAETPPSVAAQLTWLCKQHPAAPGMFVRPSPAISAGPGRSARSPPPS